MKLNKYTLKYSSGNKLREYYINTQGQLHGPYTRFYLNGHQECCGSHNFNRNIGLWKKWNHDGTRWWIDTNKNGRLNGVLIEFYTRES